MGISDRKRSIDVPVNINLDLNQGTNPNQFLVDNNFKGGDFVSRKKSGNIFAGSKLNVDGQGIYNVKIITPDLFKKFPKETLVSEGNPPTPTPTPSITPTNTPTPSITPTNTPTNTVTPTVTQTPTNTVTPTITPTPTLPPSFVSVWRTTGATETITLPYSVSGVYTGTIDWGDGNTSVNLYTNRVHTYTGAGDYTVTIYGTTNGWAFVNTGDKLKIREVLRWGPLKISDGLQVFRGCSNLVLTGVTDTIDLTSINSLLLMFDDCSSLTTINNVNNWNVSGITNMGSMFTSSNFDDDISSWDVSEVINMAGMFSFTPFNHNINSWNVSNVTNMNQMFRFGSFNQLIGSWDVSSVTTMSAMFDRTPFNQDISMWNVSGVTIMFDMFRGTPFNQNIGSWDTSSVTNMVGMFNGATSFNQPLSGWNVSNVTNMNRMFSDASVFNQPLSGWNVSNVTDMTLMFHQTSFNQNIGDWNISGVTGFTSFMLGKTPLTFSTTNLDAIYSGWSTKNPKPNLNITFGSANYTILGGQAGKNILTGSTMSGGYEWTIIDGGGI